MNNILLLKHLCNNNVHCDAGNEPCFLVGVSPSVLRALSCFTGVFFTGHPCLALRYFGLKSSTLIHTMLDGVRRVEPPSPLSRTKDTRITTSPLSANRQYLRLVSGGIKHV
jgi:hypothetical protein